MSSWSRCLHSSPTRSSSNFQAQRAVSGFFSYGCCCCCCPWPFQLGLWEDRASLEQKHLALVWRLYFLKPFPVLMDILIVYHFNIHLRALDFLFLPSKYEFSLFWKSISALFLKKTAFCLETWFKPETNDSFCELDVAGCVTSNGLHGHAIGYFEWVWMCFFSTPSLVFGYSLVAGHACSVSWGWSCTYSLPLTCLTF